jgi:hypothetical protein
MFELPDFRKIAAVCLAAGIIIGIAIAYLL